MVRFILQFIILLFAPLALATPAQDLLHILNQTHTLSGNFTQTIYDSHHKVLEKSHGTMALVRPGKFRWEVKEPIAQLLIANNQRLWIYDPDLQQVTIHKLNNAARGTPAFLLSQGGEDLEKDFTVQDAHASSADERWFLLIPKNKDSSFEQLQLGFRQNQITAMRLDDNLGHVTLIQFTKMNINSSLNDSLFIFKTPKNVDVIKNFT